MGGVELGKIWLGRKDERAWLVGSVMPAGIFGIWRRCPYKGLRKFLKLIAKYFPPKLTSYLLEF